MIILNDGDAQQDAPAGAEPATPSATPEKPPSPNNCRNFIRRQTANAMPDIVNKFVDKAKEGSVPHFTSLAKVGGFDQRSGAPEMTMKRKTRSLARQLLDEAERYEARLAAEKTAEAAQLPNQIDGQIDNLGPQENS